MCNRPWCNPEIIVGLLTILLKHSLGCLTMICSSTVSPVDGVLTLSIDLIGQLGCDLIDCL